MTILDTPDLPTPKVTPAMMVGVASPLWAYFGGAAMTGVAYWWMTRWAHPANLEALFGAAAGPLKVVEAAASETTALVSDATAEVVESVPPVGGEAAPVSPIVAATTPVEAAAEVAEALQSVSPAPAVIPEPEAAPDAAAPPEPVSTARARRTPPPMPQA